MNYELYEQYDMILDEGIVRCHVCTSKVITNQEASALLETCVPRVKKACLMSISTSIDLFSEH